MKKGQVRYWLAAILVLAFGLRLLANHLFEGLQEGPSRRGFGADAVEFNAIAVNLAERGEYAITPGHPTSFRAPGFPFALAAVYRVAGTNNYVAARFFFCLIGALLCWVVFLLGRDLAGEAVGLWAALLTASYPNILYYSIHFASEPLFTLLLTTSVWLWLRAWRQQSAQLQALAGLALGLGALTRPVAFYFMPFFLVSCVWLGRKNWVRTGQLALLYAVAVVSPIVPWALRNYAVHQRWCLFTTNGGSTFWGSNNQLVLNDPARHGQWISTERMGAQKDDVRALPNEVDRDRLEWAHGKRFVREHWQDLPRMAWYKLQEFWTPFCKTPNRQFNWIVGVSYSVTIPLILAGAWYAFRRQLLDRADWLTVFTPICATNLSCLIFYGSARFRSTIEALLLVLAAIACVRLTCLHRKSISTNAVPNPLSP